MVKPVTRARVEEVVVSRGRTLHFCAGEVVIFAFWFVFCARFESGRLPKGGFWRETGIFAHFRGADLFFVFVSCELQ